jgi:indolepyruvate ferredoxin oxidoreductase beta subunit
MEERLHVKQSEVHGMAQRGGAVMASLRISDREIASDLIPQGTAAMILSMEPLESLRYLAYLSPQGKLITSLNPVRNIPDYPDQAQLLAQIRRVPGSIAMDAEKLARQAGSARATNMVMVGAASRLLPIKTETIENAVRLIFISKGAKIIDINLRAFQAGREAAQF